MLDTIRLFEFCRGNGSNAVESVALFSGMPDFVTVRNTLNVSIRLINLKFKHVRVQNS